MSGIRALRKIQFGPETTAGTATTATHIWRGIGTIEDQLTMAYAEEDVGIVQPTNRAYIPKVQAALTFDPVPATFEQLPIILEAAIKTVWTGATADTGSGKVYAYSYGTTSVNTIKTFTIEGGDDSEQESFAYGFVKSFSLEGTAGEAWMVSADWQGREVSTTDFTTSLTLDTVEEALFSKTTLYIDTSGSIGTTSKANTLLSATLNVGDTGNVAVYTADGNLYFGFQKQQRPADPWTLEVTFEHNSTAVAEIAAWRAKTVRAIRLLTTGTALTTTGATHATKKLIIDCFGVWDKFSKIDEQDGNDIVTGTLNIGYDATGGSGLTITVVNELENLT